MAEQAREYFRYYGETTDGSRKLLLDTLDFYSNHSALPMHTVGESGETVDFVLNREVKKLLHLLKLAVSDSSLCQGYQVINLLLVAFCLRKYKPLKLLHLGGRIGAGMTGFCELLPKFHPDNRLYWLTQAYKEQRTDRICMTMPWEELLLPQNTFDMIVLDDTDECLLPSIKEQIWLALRPEGQIILLSRRREIRHVFIGERSETYLAGDGWAVSQSTISAAEHEAMAADTWESAVKTIQQEAIERIQLVQKEVTVEGADIDALLQLADETEQFILLIYASLPSLELKYLTNEWKRALLEYRLGWGQVDRIQQKGRELLAEL